MNYLKAQEILPYLPMRWRMTASFNPYVIPIFGKMYYGRIKSIIKLLLESHRKFPNVLEVGGGIGVFSANFKKLFQKVMYIYQINIILKQRIFLKVFILKDLIFTLNIILDVIYREKLHLRIIFSI